jgi:Carboxypeptidase regulatory-like domain/TonB dependent receptor
VSNFVALLSVKSAGVNRGHAISPLAKVTGLVSLWLLVFLALSPNAQAQLYTGSVTGLVTDPSGAAVPSAKITLVDQNKGYSFTATTDAATGRYVLRSISPGTYKITVEAANFQGQTREGITLDVSQNITVDFSLKVGAATVTVEVKGTGVQLQTEDAVTGQTVNRRFVNDLPLVDRNFFSLAFLAPGVTETNAPGANGPINFNSNGSRNSTADVLIDGASATNFEQNSGIQSVPYTPSVDSIEEFKVQQSNFTAEYGFAGTTIINVVTRSGGNQFHGGVGEFFRNSVMDANDWFNNKNGTPIAALKRNNFGGTIGGPIRKGKTFFFFDYEGTRETTSADSGQMGVPSLCERGIGTCGIGDPNNPSAGLVQGQSKLGNFSELCTLQGFTFDNTGMCSDPRGQLWDPYSTLGLPPDPNNGATRTKFIPFNNLADYVSPGEPNLVGTPFQLPAGPGNLIDPVAQKLFLLFPKPTINATDFGTLQNSNFFSSGSRSSSNNQFDIKVDHRFSDRDQLSVRYSQQKSSSKDFNCFGNFADPCTSGPGIVHRYQVAINHTHTFSPTLVLTVTYGLVRGFDFQKGIGGEFSNINSSFAQVGFPSYLNNGFHTIPGISIGSYSSGNAGNSIGTANFSITREGQDSHHLGGSVSWVRGKHELKFGGEGRMHRINHVNPGWPDGLFSFDFTSTSQFSAAGDPTVAGGDGMASFLIGVGSPNNTGGGCTPCQQGFNNFVSTQSFRYGAFVQDNYRVTPKLTLNLGMRYEISLPRTERFNRMNWLDPNAPSPLQLPGLAPLHGIEVFVSPKNRTNYYTDYKAIQPRFGLAYQLPHAFVVRGGYGIYFSTPRSGAAGTGPWGYQGFNIQPPWLSTLNIDGATPYNSLKNTSCLFAAPFTCGVAPPPGSSLGAFNDIGGDAVGPIPSVSQNIPYEQAWSLGFQKELPGKILLDATYVGKKGTHLYLGAFRNINRLPTSAIAGMTPAQIGNLKNGTVANPFFFDPTQFPAGTACDPTRFICDPASGLAGPTVNPYRLLVPFPQYTSFQGDSPPIANSIYHALQVRVEKEFSNGLQFLMTYSWSKSIDDASTTDDSVVFLGGGILNTGNSLNVQNPFDLRAERGVSVFDIPQILQFSYVYELPVGRGKAFGRNMNPVLNAIVGGWQTNGIFRMDNGRPILPLLENTTPIPTWSQRPNLTGTLQRASGSPENFTDVGTSYFSNANAVDIGNNSPNSVLQKPPNFTLGSAPRSLTSVRQPGARDVSMSIFKEFPLAKVREGMHLQFRAESFNTFNHPHFQGPNVNVGSSNFGVISSTVNSPRELQLALKLSF